MYSLCFALFSIRPYKRNSKHVILVRKYFNLSVKQKKNNKNNRNNKKKFNALFYRTWGFKRSNQYLTLCKMIPVDFGPPQIGNEEAEKSMLWLICDSVLRLYNLFCFNWWILKCLQVYSFRMMRTMVCLAALENDDMVSPLISHQSYSSGICSLW